MGEFDNGLFPGYADFMPTDEDRRRARRDGFLQAGFAMLMNPYRGQEAQAIGGAGMAGMGTYRQALGDATKERQAAMLQAAQAQKMQKEAQQMDFVNRALDAWRNRGQPAPAAQAAVGAPQGAPGASTPMPVGGGAPAPVSAGGNDELEMLLAMVGKKEAADVLHRQGSITQGPMGTLMRNGSVIGQVTNGGIIYYDGSPNGRFVPMNPDAVKAGVDAKAAEKRAELDVGSQYDLVDVPVPGGTRQMTKADALRVARAQGAPAGGGQRVKVNLDNVTADEAYQRLEQIFGPRGAPAPTDAYVKPGPVEQHAAEAAIDTTEAGKRAGGSLIQKQVDASYGEAQNSATNGIATIHEARAALESGNVIAGAGADWRLGLDRVLGLAGNADAAERAAATQTFAATQARQVLGIIKQLGSGSGISDADREYAAKIVGGSIPLEEASMRKLLDISERAQRALIKAHNGRAAKAASVLKDDNLRDFYTVEEPPAYKAPEKQQSSVPTLTPAARGNRTAQVALDNAIRAGDQAAIDRLRQKGYVQ